MKYIAKYAALIATGMIALSGCIRDEIGPCPSLTVRLSVKDRMYANSAETQFDDPHKNQTDFTEVVPTLYYLLRDAQTEEMVQEMPVRNVTTAGETYVIEFGDGVPYGQYLLTVWGGVKDENEIGSNPLSLDLSDLDHELYLSNMPINYEFGKEEAYAEMERVNGIVVVETIWETFPKHMNASEKTFTGLSKSVDSEMHFDEQQEMLLHYSWDTSDNVTSTTILPPSHHENGTKLYIRYYDKDNPELKGVTYNPISLTVKRNQVTKIRIMFDPYTKSIVVATMVNGQWQVKHDMNVD